MLRHFNQIFQRLFCSLRLRRDGVFVSFKADCVGAEFEGRTKIYGGARVSNSAVGRGSYVGPNSNLSNCKIGRYCSIGPDVLVLAATHPIDGRLSTHPCFYSTNKQSGFTYADQQSFEEFLYYDTEHRYYVEIGSDVWIGARVIIVGGVRIGHGAVIAAGSVVTKDVEDYSIVGGVPAKHLRYRFSESVRSSYLEECWWDQDEDWILENMHRFRAEI